MPKLDILTFPDPRLRKKALPVDHVDDAIGRLVGDMLETMYAAPGIGLAANQVDVQRRVVVMDLSEGHDSPMVFINPKILWKEGTEQMDEGCLSVPGFFETVTRAERVRVQALDRDGKPFTLEADGLLAVCIQHEIDHLDGKLFVDHISMLKRQRIRRKLEKLEKERHAAPSDAAAAGRKVV
ncbi:peptide deformylase [Thiocystis violacea]|uniref:peptide deformylase n=1 Tax=Thiocystis violacea TaxID=13725 RepID=UPI001906FBFD|nr:peptide deformylase [Thiocystis violacea]MBK1722790.1 peptide deformylase [Thiocystis violacea]